MYALQKTTRSMGAAAALCLSSLALQAQAQAVNPNELYTRSLAATCANCHGTDGRAVPNSTVPSIAGMPAAYITEQMKAFKSGARPATVMHQLAKGYSDEQIVTIANYFAAVKR
jgi:sulfide dehydrogenase cytochrome subunit